MKVEEKGKVEDQTLSNFNWEDDNDFFGIEAEKIEKVEEKKEEVKEEEKKEEVKEKVEEAFFEEENGEEKKEVKKKEDTKDQYWGDVYKDFKEKGILKHIEIEEGEEIDSDRLFEIQQEEYEAEVSARLQTWAKDELDEDAQAFIKFKRDGGNTEDFLQAYSNSSELPVGDIEDEGYQDKVIRYQLKSEGWDSEEIEDRLKYFTESGKKENIAGKYDKRLKKIDATNKADLQKKALEQKRAIVTQEKEFNTGIKSILAETKDIQGIKITPKEKNDLYNLITKKQYKVSNTKSITGFQKKLGEVFQDTNKMIILAKLLNTDFDMKDFEKATTSKKVKQIKSNLEQRKNLRPNNSGSSLAGTSLAELF